jgi:hypothetical protein
MPETPETPETADNAIRGWLALLSSACLVIGGQQIIQFGNYIIGIAVCALSVLIYWMRHNWSTIKVEIPKQSIPSLNRVATDARWWFGVVGLLLLTIILTPAVRSYLLPATITAPTAPLPALPPPESGTPNLLGQLRFQLDQLRYQQGLVLGRVSWFNIFNALKEPPQNLRSPPKQWVLISATPENAIVAEDLFSLFFLSWTASKTLSAVNLPNYDRDLDAPKLEGKGLSGITIHGRTAAADFIANSLGNCYQIHRTSEMPQGLADYYLRTNPTWMTSDDVFTWLEVGNGSPWARSCIGPGN